MVRYDKYLRYVLRHKWYVFLECYKLGISWRGIVHDLSKFRPSEFVPYARHFYSPEYVVPEGHYDKAKDVADAAFDMAWLKHQHRNPHHWQSWLLIQDEGGVVAFDMFDAYRREMLADWHGAGIAQGYGNNTEEWYRKTRHNMTLHLETREWVETQIYGAPLNDAPE